MDLENEDDVYEANPEEVTNENCTMITRKRNDETLIKFISYYKYSIQIIQQLNYKNKLLTYCVWANWSAY